MTQQNFEDAINDIIKDPKKFPKGALGQLLFKVNINSAKVRGSLAALKFRRNDIRAYTIHFGNPHFYITINPADIHAPLMLKIGGIDIKPEMLGKKNYEFRARFLRNNPVLQSIYFDIIVKNFIKFLLRYSKENNDEGILGIVKTFYIMIETQDRGSLHAHMLIWLKNALNPSEYKDKIKNNKFRSEMLAFIDQIIHCDFDGLIDDPEFVATIHPCCISPDYLKGDLNNENIMNDFLKDVYITGKSSAIHKCTKSCKTYGSGDTCRHGFDPNMGKN